MRMITTKAVAIWLGGVWGAGQMGTLYAQSIKTSPAQDQDGRPATLQSIMGPKGAMTRLLPFRRLVTLL